MNNKPLEPAAEKLAAVEAYLRQAFPRARIVPHEVPAAAEHRYGLAVDREDGTLLTVIGTWPFWKDCSVVDITHGLPLLGLAAEMRAKKHELLDRIQDAPGIAIVHAKQNQPAQ